MAEVSEACDDCGLRFPLRQGSELCPKCVKLKPHWHAIDSAEYTELQKWPQCTVCGVTRRNMPVSTHSAQTCGSSLCTKAGTPTGEETPAPLGPSLVANAAFETNQNRAALMRDRMKRFQATKNGGAPGTALTTATLQEHEHGGGAPGEPKIWVCWQVRLSSQPKVIAAGLGYHTKGWAVSKFMPGHTGMVAGNTPDIKAEITKIINTEWCQNRSSPLLAEEVDFRWHGNRILDPGTHTLPLNDFYAHYSTPSNAPIYLQNVPTHWKSFERTRGSKRFICMELYVRVDKRDLKVRKWEERVLESDSEKSSSRKRARTLSSASTSVKQPRLSVPGSNFSLSRRTTATDIKKWSPITFRKIKCITDDVDGAPKLIEEEVMRGRIFDEPFSSGTMKHAHDLIMANGDQFVAKRFFKLSDDSDADSVTVQENRLEIEGELLRLAWGRWFLNGFYQFCKKQREVDVDENAFLALTEEVDLPSIASGVPIITDKDIGMTWLVERKRPMTVTKYSGTLVHTSARKDLRSLTICAFAHFAFGFSDQSIVFADLQGSPAQVRGGDGLVLFDLMAHTQNGDCGIGDFGKQGIESFTRDHQCNSICSALGFDTQYPLKPRSSRNTRSSRRTQEEPESDDSDDDEDEDQLEDELQRESDDNN
ncbi:kinase-like domain-containing protein [Mycena pura]|uniref:Kinase-like domain-containing protein n=1 Tax=Mycena pura TaxID=153505 RepID=A0AAD6VCV8_9AGAR|nr:kinase-like domain-containing protein [Mycena pura]